MGSVLSIDLAYKRSCHIGVCVLQKPPGGGVSVRFLSGNDLGIPDDPPAQQCAECIHKFCRGNEIHIVFLDGPQGWKCPASPLPFSRLCDRLVNAQAKVGVKGQVLPRNFKRFVEFSIAVFARLRENGALLAQKPDIEVQPGQLMVVESYPRSAWAKIGLSPLPGKKKATRADTRDRFDSLRGAFELYASQEPTHDQLCGLVAGLAGLAILSGNK